LSVNHSENVSVIVATFNGAKYLQAQLESIISELRSGDEIIIVDDLSSDETVNLAKQFLASTCHGKVSFAVGVKTSNSGHFATFVDGIERASNDIIFLADQDDVWTVGRVDRMLVELSGGANGVFGSLQSFGDSTVLIPAGNARIGFLRTLVVVLGIHPGCKLFGSACAFRKSKVDTLLGRTTRSHEEWLALQLSIEGQIALIPDIVTLRRVHGNNLTRRQSFRRILSRRGQMLLLGSRLLIRKATGD
jgi:glycosyltransferase involved in cell wall biosynthesis